ncbi:hypothetical protein CYLTODRAFT_427567 [Cylindrobasidium torrendii FP15055 ss-10]|uniref:Mediator complex subunit 9 n=1 Tax=Cylindrobasidium torrendii FP15055 ss-10 TaxID=1314674 RepID=A0A0D7ATN8_9AGAR|nr:hypothetical protein CYLTODRAFT_427567 [Cylindrobasidium torrendii FP15055 ss-10]
MATPSAFTPVFMPGFTPSYSGQATNVPSQQTNSEDTAGSSTLPTSLYASLLSKLVTVLELDPCIALSGQQGRQALLTATNDFKFSLARAKELAAGLPGGELMLEEQDEIIEMLEAVKNGKKAQLEEFAGQVEAHKDARLILGKPPLPGIDVDMDSAASTPAS